MVLHASTISESEVSITALCLLCSPSYTAVWSKNCLKSTSVIKVAAVKNTIVPCAPIIIRNRSIHCPSLSAMFNLLYKAVRINCKNCLKSTSVTTMEKYGWFLVRKGSHHMQPPNQRFSLSAKMNGRFDVTSGTFWHTAICAMYSPGIYQCPPLCSVNKSSLYP